MLANCCGIIIRKKLGCAVNKKNKKIKILSLNWSFYRRSVKSKIWWNMMFIRKPVWEVSGENRETTEFQILIWQKNI